MQAHSAYFGCSRSLCSHVSGPIKLCVRQARRTYLALQETLNTKGNGLRFMLVPHYVNFVNDPIRSIATGYLWGGPGSVLDAISLIVLVFPDF